MTRRENKNEAEEIAEICYSIGSCIVAKYMKAKGKDYVAMGSPTHFHKSVLLNSSVVLSVTKWSLTLWDITCSDTLI